MTDEKKTKDTEPGFTVDTENSGVTEMPSITRLLKRKKYGDSDSYGTGGTRSSVSNTPVTPKKGPPVPPPYPKPAAAEPTSEKIQLTPPSDGIDLTGTGTHTEVSQASVPTETGGGI